MSISFQIMNWKLWWCVCLMVCLRWWCVWDDGVFEMMVCLWWWCVWDDGVFVMMVCLWWWCVCDDGVCVCVWDDGVWWCCVCTWCVWWCVYIAVDWQNRQDGSSRSSLKTHGTARRGFLQCLNTHCINCFSNLVLDLFVPTIDHSSWHKSNQYKQIWDQATVSKRVK
jgi:hypothetical protein